MSYSKKVLTGCSRSHMWWPSSQHPGYFLINGPWVAGQAFWLAVTDDYGTLVVVQP